MIKLSKLIFEVLLGFIILIVIAYIFWGFVANIDVDVNYYENYILKTNKTEYPTVMKISNNRFLDLTDINIQVFELTCQVLDIGNPKLDASALTKGCEITHPEEGVATNYMNVYCDRINTLADLKIDWFSYDEPNRSCEIFIKYQSGINPAPYFKNPEIYKKYIPQRCGDAICNKEESSSCCLDCGCENEFACYDNTCLIPEIEITSFKPIRDNFYLAGKSFVEVNFSTVVPFDHYNFTIYWKRPDSDEFKIGYYNESSLSKNANWFAWNAANMWGDWQSKVSLNYGDNEVSKIINVSVISDLNVFSYLGDYPEFNVSNKERVIYLDLIKTDNTAIGQTILLLDYFRSNEVPNIVSSAVNETDLNLNVNYNFLKILRAVSIPSKIANVQNSEGNILKIVEVYDGGTWIPVDILSNYSIGEVSEIYL